MKRFILIICQLIFISAIQVTGQISVSTATDLQNAINTASSDVTITLTTDFVAGNMILTQPNANVTVDGGGFIWDTGSIRVNGSGTGTLTIKNLKMDGTTATDKLFISNSSNGNLILYKMEFYNSQKGAIDISTSQGASTVISYANIYNNTSDNTASAIWVGANNSSLIINNSTIENNIGKGGGYQCGAIASNFHTGYLEINNSVFRNNVNKCYNTGVIGGGGGAMSLHYFKGILNINESLFYGNKSNGEGVPIGKTYDGGAIYIFDGRDGAKVNINKTTFDSNLAYDDGGAMLIQGTGNPGLTTTITNCTFYKNKAYGLTGGNVGGGAIQFFKNGGSSVMSNTILSCTFVGNELGHENSTIDQKGGAVALSGNNVFLVATVTYNGSLFAGNKVYGSNGLINNSSNYKDISNSTLEQAGARNVINVDKGATPAYTDENVLGENYSLCENLSGIIAGVNDEIVKTIPIKPQGIADNTYNGTVTLPTTDQRNFNKNKDQGAIEMAWVRFDANGGTWTGLDDNFAYKGTDYYKSISSETAIYFKVTYSGGKVTLPSATLTPPVAGQTATWVIDDGDSDDNNDVEWNPADPIIDNVLVKAVWKSSKFTVTYNGNSSDDDSNVPVDSNLYDEDDEVTVFGHGTLAKAGHTFIGWEYSENNSITYQDGNKFNMPAANVTLTAKWVPNAQIIYKPNGGVGADVIVDTYIGATVNANANTFTRSGYTFLYWNTLANNTGTTYNVGNVINVNAATFELYAQWSKNPTPPVIPPVVDPKPEPEPEKPDPEKPQPKPELGITLEGLQIVCSDETIVTIPFELIYKGSPIQYLVKFSEEAKAAGCVDETTYKSLPTNNSISFTIPSNMPNKKYKGTIVLKTDSSNVLIPSYPFEFEVMNSVRIIKHPVSTSNICEGDGFKLTVEAVGDELAYQWYLNDKKIPNANSSTYEAPLTKENEGIYFVEVIGICGAERSKEAIISSNNFRILIKWDDVLYVLNLDNRYVSYQWYKDALPIQEYGKAVYYTHPDGLLGTYKVRAYKADGTYDESCSMTFSEKTKAISAAVYPNPVARNENISVVISEIGESKATIHIYDITGRQVYNTKTTMIKTDIPVNLPTGTYVVKVTLESGKTISQKLIVK